MRRQVWLAILLVAVASSTAVLAVMFLKQPTSPASAPSFRVQVDPVSVLQGDQARVNVTIVSENNFDSAVTFRVFNLPGSMTALWNPELFTPPRNGLARSELTLDVPLDIPAQIYPLTINATGGGISKTAVLLVTVLQLPPSPIFGLTVNPARLTVDKGQSDYANVTVTSLNGFNSPLTLIVTRFQGVNATFPDGTNATIMTPPPNATSVLRLDIAVSGSATTRFYSLNVTATNSTLTRARSLVVNVPPPSVSFYLIGWTEGWNSTETDPSTIEPCSPSGTPICNPSLSAVQGQKIVVSMESVDFSHNLAYYSGGYPWSSIYPPNPLPNPDALNTSVTMTPVEPTASLTYRFESAGTYEYYCDYHEYMHGNVTVIPNASPAPASRETGLNEEGAAIFSPIQPLRLEALDRTYYWVETTRDLG